MSLSTYADLVVAVSSYLAREGDGDLAEQIPTFVTLCEQRITYGADKPIPSEALRIRGMESSETLTMVAGTKTVALPSGYLGMRRDYLDMDPYGRVEYRAPGDFWNVYIDATNGQPKIFTIEGENLVFGPTPDSAYTFQMLAYIALPSIITNSTNWLMTNAPGIYLYGTLLEAFLFEKDEARAQQYAGYYSALCDGLQLQDRDDRHSGSSLRVTTDTGNP